MQVAKKNVFEAVQNKDGNWVLTGNGVRPQVFTDEDFKANFIPVNVVEPKKEGPKIDHSPMVIIDVIPQDKQRYPTVGDWQWCNGILVMHISDMENKDYEFMVVIHEMIEAWLCRKRGITQEMVDAWDNGEGKDLEDPGSDERAPYHKEHMLALQIERALCDEMGLNWEEYEECLAATCPTQEQ